MEIKEIFLGFLYVKYIIGVYIVDMLLRFMEEYELLL